MEPISPILYSLFRGTPRHSDWVLACLQGAWPGLLGSKLARVCRPCRFDQGRLGIEVLDQSWTEALRACEPEVLQKVRTATGGEVHSVFFKPAAS